VKFVLHTAGGVPIGEGRMSEPLTGPPVVLIWRGDTFLVQPERFESEGKGIPYRQTTGHLLDHFQATPIRGAPSVWSSPTAIGRLAAEQRPDVIDSIADGYVQPAPAVLSDLGAGMPPRRRRGDPS
jgi:hypothetical protein